MKEHKKYNIECLKDRIPYSKKKRDDFEWAKQRAEYYDQGYFDIMTKRYENMRKNYRMYRGIPDNSNYKFLTNPIDPELSSSVPFVSYPIIDKVIKAIHGEEIRRNLKPIVMAVNSDSISSRNRQRTKMMQEYLYNSIFGGLQQEMEMQMQQAKTQEEQQQIQQQFEQKKQEMTPKEIELFMSKEFRLPEEMQGQQILSVKLKQDRVKYEFDTAFLQGLISGIGVVEVEGYPRPKLRALNPLFFTYEKSFNSPFIHEGSAWTYSEYLTLPEVYEQFSEELTEEDMKKLDNIRSGAQHEPMYPHPGMFNWDYLEDIDNPLLWLNDNYIRKVRVVFKTLKLIKKITRLSPETGMIEEIIVDESYVSNPQLDLSEEKEWIPELWSVTKLDLIEPIYLRIGPIENQYRDLDNPKKITPPYIGVIYDIVNADEPVSVVSKGSYWQELYDIVMHYFKIVLATDWGNIITLNINSKPSELSTGEWLHTAVTKKFLLLDLNKEGTNPAFDAQAIKGVALSNASDLTKYMNILAYIQKQCFEAMYYNESRLGITMPYQTATANQQDIIQSSTQTMPYFNMHRLLVKDALELYLELWRRYYVENPEELALIADDMTVVSLTIDPRVIDLKKYGVFIEDDTDSQQILEQMKANAREIIQTTGGDLRIVLELLTAKDPMEIKNKISRLMEDMEEKQAQAQQQQQAMEQERMKHEMEMLQAKFDHEMQLKQVETEGKMATAAIDVQKFALAQDVDSNKQADTVEKAKLEIAQKEKDRELKEKIETEKLKLEEKKIEAMKNRKKGN